MSGRGAADPLDAARRAASEGRWEESFDLYLSADAAGQVGPEDLPSLAEVAYAVGELDVTITAWERVYGACRAAGDEVGAAGAAARVAMHLLFDTALLAPVRGWLARAEAHLCDQPESPALAWAAVVRTYERILGGDLEAAATSAQIAVDVGGRLDPAASAIGRVASARLRILDGDVDAGLADLDEVGVALVAGDLDPLSTGVVYCELVCALQGIAEYDLAEQWTEAMERWCQTNAIGSLHGRCRVHRAEILRLRGHLDEAEAQATAACDELRPYLRRELGWPLNELGTIRLRRGDLDGASQALLAAHHAGWDPQPGLAELRLADGDVPAASAALRWALEQSTGVPSKERPPSSSLRRAPLLGAQVEVEIAAGNLDLARAAATELTAIAERFRSKALVASAALATGRIELALGALPAARSAFSEAEQLWVEVGAPHETALARAGLERCGSEGGALARVGDGRMPAPPSDGACSFVFAGDFWSIEFSGASAKLRDRKGMRHLARLLAAPGRELHALDLVAADTGVGDSDGTRASRISGGQADAGELLDAEAKQAYRRRLEEIDDDIDQAVTSGDGERAARAEEEREFLLRELSRAFGLGGRARRAGSASERARVAVTRAIRQAMTGIAEHHPVLGEHLARAIQTGTYCAYLPDTRVEAGWSVTLPPPVRPARG